MRFNCFLVFLFIILIRAVFSFVFRVPQEGKRDFFSPTGGEMLSEDYIRFANIVFQRNQNLFDIQKSRSEFIYT